MINDLTDSHDALFVDNLIVPLADKQEPPAITFGDLLLILQRYCDIQRAASRLDRVFFLLDYKLEAGKLTNALLELSVCEHLSDQDKAMETFF
jgi:hypothetical protein